MDFISLVNAYDLFTDGFVYGSITYLSIRFLVHLVLCFLALVNECKITKLDFYDQVKELLNPPTETVLDLSSNPSFDCMTLRELRAHIKENQLQQHVRDCLGKTVSNARKHELITALS